LERQQPVGEDGGGVRTELGEQERHAAPGPVVGGRAS
jgi:hypothetical protein